MLAVEAPLLKLTVVGGVLAAVAAFAPHGHRHHCHHHGKHKLELHAVSSSHAIYLSEFELSSNDVWMDVDKTDLKPMEFETRATVYGCHWVANEVFLPAGDHYNYTYTDHIESCNPNGTPTAPTPRSGTVTIE